MVVTNQVLEHVEDLGGAFGELARVLRPDGTLIAYFPRGRYGVRGISAFPLHTDFAEQGCATLMSLRCAPSDLDPKADKSCSQWTQDAFDWIDRYTYHRSRPEIERILAARFEVTHLEIDYIEHRLRGGPKLSLFNRLGPRPLAIFALRRLAGLVVKAKRNPYSGSSSAWPFTG